MDDQKAMEDLWRLFSQELESGKAIEDIIALDRCECLLVAAWQHVDSFVNECLGEGSPFSKALLGALCMLQLIHDDDDVARIVLSYAGMNIWRKVIGNARLCELRGQETLIVKDMKTPVPQVDLEEVGDVDVAVGTVMSAVLFASSFVTDVLRELPGGDTLSPQTVAAVVICDMCYNNPILCYSARRVPALMVVQDAMEHLN